MLTSTPINDAKVMKYKFFLFIAVFFLLFCSEEGFAGESKIYVIEIVGSINPGVVGFLEKGIKKASDANACCIIIKLDTPGGLVASTRDIVKTIFGSRIPVVVYVSPSGARAASAGVMITMAADIAAMAPATSVGAAHPVAVGGREMDEVMLEKVVSDLAAFSRGIAERRGRNAEWAEKAVRENLSATEKEALEKNVIDIVAKDMDDLIRQLDGREVEEKWVLNLDNYKINIIEEGIGTKVLRTISDPSIAYILMMIGLAGIYFELSNPGMLFPGVIGSISLILAFFAFQALPVNHAGILLILLAFIFFVMEFMIASYGLLSIAGIISFLLGSLMLFEGYDPALRLPWGVILPTLAVVSGFFVVVSTLVFKSHMAKPKTGINGLIGEVGVVKVAIMPEGKVLVHGELWNATSKDLIQKDVKVRVVSVEDLVLEVEQVKR